MAESDDSGLTSGTVELSVTHALVAVFAVGVLVGGMGAVALGATGMFSAPTDSGSGNTDTGSGDGGSDRVQISESFIQDEPTLGDASAELVIIEMSDYGCPWCAEWAGVDAIPQRSIDQQDSFHQIVSNYVETGDARFVYKDYPVQQLHPNAPQAHVAANCILEQDGSLYWDFHDALFEQRDSWTANGAGETQQTFRSIAQDIGADADAMDSCIDSSDGSEVQQDLQDVRDALGQIGTPTFLIGTFEDGFVQVEGAQPYQNLKPVIDSELS